MDANNYNNRNDYNYVCHVCGTNFDARFGACPSCNTPVNVVIPQTDFKQLPKTSNGKKTTVIISVVLAVLVAIGGALAVVMMNNDNYSKNTAVGKGNSQKLTEQELINACDLIDYSVLAATFDKYIPSSYKGSMQTLITDADGDGRQEMFVDAPFTDDPNNKSGYSKTGAFWFDIADGNSSYDYTEKADTYEFYTDADGNVYYINFNAHRGYSEHIYKWTSNGFAEVGYYSEGIDKLPDQEGYKDVFYGSELNGKDLNTLDEFNAEKSKLGLKRINGSNSQYLSNYFYTSSPKDIINAYQKRVDNLNNGSKYISQDYDNDGENEYLFIVRYSTDSWMDVLLEAQNREQTSDWEYYEPYIPDENYDYRRDGYIYVDTDKQGVVFHAVSTDVCILTGTVEACWEDGILGISIINPNYATYYFENFCDNAENTRKALENDDVARRTAVERYISSIVNAWQGGGADPKPSVSMKYIDVCDYPGEECALTVKGTNRSYIEVCTFYCGRAIVLYRLYDSDGSVFWVNIDGKEHLLYYCQARFNDIDGSGTTYCYKTIRYDGNCRPIYRDNQAITVYDNSTPTQEHNVFFNGLNALLVNAKVCLDNYELTGYKYMQESDMSVSGDVENKYLAISNCNPTKAGLVNIQDIESWLNFREGPSTKYNKILIDPADSKSFVKQAKGSAVTVIDTVNTGDEKNPIWVKIQIKYADQTLVGYSSQNYIDIPNIKHISVGESFTITADTNDNGLVWSCNDTSILSIDSSNGTVTGIKRGLVLVTVRSDSGLSDSCLIMVD